MAILSPLRRWKSSSEIFRRAVQIAALLGGSVEGDPNVEVWNVAKIEEGAPGMLSFLANPKYTPYIYETESSVVIVNKSFVAEKTVSATLIRVDDAYASFAKLLAFYDQMSQDKKGVSSLAFISSNAQCGENVYIGEFAFLGENVKIGDNVKIYPQVYVGDGVVIGDGTTLYPGVRLYRNTVVGQRCIIHAGAVIGADGFGFAPQPDGHYDKIPQVGNVVIDDPTLHQLVKGVDLLYHESTYDSTYQHLAQRYYHSTATDAANVAKDAHAKHLLLGHYSSRYDNEEILKEEAMRIFPNVTLAQEGLVVDVG